MDGTGFSKQKKRFKCILVGRGYWGSILERYLEPAGFDPVSVYSRDSGLTFTQALSESGAECAFICSPVSSHFEYVKEALLAGKHVFCEKMLTGDATQAEELYRIAAEQGRVLFTDYIYLYSPSVRMMKEMSESLGELKLIDGSITQFGKFYTDTDVIGNIGVHMMSAAGLLTGFVLPGDLTAVGNIFISGQCADSIISCRAGEVNITVRASILSGLKERRIRVLGDRGELMFDMTGDQTLTVSRFILTDDGEMKPEVRGYSLDESNNIASSLGAFRNCIEEPCGAVFMENKTCSMYVEHFAGAADHCLMRRVAPFESGADLYSDISPKELS